MKALFISDIHLKSQNERNGQILLRFLHKISKDPELTHLFLLGDIFDVWFGSHQIYAEQFSESVQALKVLVHQGVEISYFEGNHDFHIEKFWSSQGIHVLKGIQYKQLGPWRLHLEHGDFINQDDKLYYYYRQGMDSLPMKTLIQSLPGSWIVDLGNMFSGRSRKSSSKRRQRDFSKLREMIRTYALHAWRKDKFDYLIAGHMHVQDEFEWIDKDQRVVSINLGSWYEDPHALELTDSGHQWISLS